MSIFVHKPNTKNYETKFPLDFVGFVIEVTFKMIMAQFFHVSKNSPFFHQHYVLPHIYIRKCRLLKQATHPNDANMSTTSYILIEPWLITHSALDLSCNISIRAICWFFSSFKLTWTDIIARNKPRKEIVQSQLAQKMVPPEKPIDVQRMVHINEEFDKELQIFTR